MNVKFDNKQIDVYREFFSQTKSIQEITESVVPDTDDDIGKIALVESSVLLKSKDITNRGVLISGEATAALIYITESKEKTSFVKLSKAFTIEYDIPDMDAEAVARVNLSVASAEARIINPRKVSVCFEIRSELDCYALEKLSIESGLPTDAVSGLHVKYENAELNLVNAVREKVFTLNEQYSFPSGKPRPARLLCGNVNFLVNDTQLVGTKVIIKGNAEIAVSYVSEEVNYPLMTEFVTPFSQIVDIGEEMMDNCDVIPSLTASYFEIADSISGDKLIEVEIHAVLQLLCRSNRQLVYISDAYSNLMPAECSTERLNMKFISDTRKIKISADERVNVMDDCSDVLSMFVSLARIAQEQNKIKSVVNIDIVYRMSEGCLSAVRRCVAIEADAPDSELKIKLARLTDVYLRPDGQYLDVHLSLEICGYTSSSVEIEKVVSVNLDEENKVDFSSYPAVSLVRCTGESFWEIAKIYHSSVETIIKSNEAEEGDCSGMLLVPKCV